MEGEHSGEDPPRLFSLKLASTLSTESWGNRESGGPSSNHSTETNVLIPSKLNVVQPCAGGSSKACLLASCLWEDLLEDGKRWNSSLLHPLAYLRPSLSLKNGVGASLPLVRVGWFRTEFRRVLAGRKSPAHSVYGRSFVWQEPAPALSGEGAHRVCRKKGGKSFTLRERTET